MKKTFHVFTDSDQNAWYFTEYKQAGKKRIRVSYVLPDSIKEITCFDANLPNANTKANLAASALRAIPSDKRVQASRDNGKKGGRPRKSD